MVGPLPSDATTLIYLAKADGFVDIATSLAGLLASPAVWREAVIAGEAKNAPEVERIRAAERNGLVQRIDLSASTEALAASIATEHRLGRGESEVLAVATERGSPTVIDEGRAARVAGGLGVRVVSTMFLPVLGFRSQTLTRDDALRLVRRLGVAAGATAEVLLLVEEELIGEGT
jgi:predicted nucleic acid-binding protein